MRPGTAIVLEYDFRDATQDVERELEGSCGAIIAAQQQVAQEFGLPAHWLNAAATSYLSSEADFGLFETYPDQSRPGLVVYVATPQYLLAMKAQSQRIKDMSHAVVLGRKIGITTADHIIGLVTRFYTAKPKRIDPQARVTLESTRLRGRPCQSTSDPAAIGESKA